MRAHLSLNQVQSKKGWSLKILIFAFTVSMLQWTGRNRLNWITGLKKIKKELYAALENTYFFLAFTYEAS